MVENYFKYQCVTIFFIIPQTLHRRKQFLFYRISLLTVAVKDNFLKIYILNYICLISLKHFLNTLKTVLEKNMSPINCFSNTAYIYAFIIWFIAQAVERFYSNRLESKVLFDKDLKLSAFLKHG